MEKPRTTLQEAAKDGSFVRSESKFRNWISSAPSSAFTPETKRYHLYVSYACPWANRCIVALYMKGLEDVIGMTVVHPTWQRTRPNIEDDTHTGWVFTKPGTALSTSGGFGSYSFDDTTEDPINGCKSIRDLYDLAGDTHKKYSVPVLWDKSLKTIVNNESSEIIEMFDKEFNAFAKYPGRDLFPDIYREKMKAVDEWIYANINNGVYRNGFAKTQEAYNQANEDLFNSLDRLEDLLSRNKYLCGDTLTASDIRCFMTLVRFDEVYVVYFKCDRKRIVEYPNILRYCRDMWREEGVRRSIHMKHIKTHYFSSHKELNFYGIIPTGPDFLSRLE